MYFSSIANHELVNFHEKVNVNYHVKISEVFNNKLFIVEEMGELLKVIPLFYTKIITSSNPNDRIVENKVILCENNNDTVLYFDNGIQPVNPELEVQVYDKHDYIICYLFDRKTGKPLDVVCDVKLLYSTHPGSTQPIVVVDFELTTKDGVMYYLLDPSIIEDPLTDVNGYNIEFIMDGEIIGAIDNVYWRDE